jgi:hypothetical protein
MHPDPGRDIQERLIADMSLDRRVAVGERLRRTGHLLVWQQADAAAAREPMNQLERAFFILDRLYPQMPPQHREQFRARLSAGWEAGTWHGFQRPAPLVDSE